MQHKNTPVHTNYVGKDEHTTSKATRLHPPPPHKNCTTCTTATQAIQITNKMEQTPVHHPIIRRTLNKYRTQNITSTKAIATINDILQNITNSDSLTSTLHRHNIHIPQHIPKQNNTNNGILVQTIKNIMHTLNLQTNTTDPAHNIPQQKNTIRQTHPNNNTCHCKTHINKTLKYNPTICPNCYHRQAHANKNVNNTTPMYAQTCHTCMFAYKNTTDTPCTNCIAYWELHRNSTQIRWNKILNAPIEQQAHPTKIQLPPIPTSITNKITKTEAAAHTKQNKTQHTYPKIREFLQELHKHSPNHFNTHLTITDRPTCATAPHHIQTNPQAKHININIQEKTPKCTSSVQQCPQNSNQEPYTTITFRDNTLHK